jgi:ABC-type dipeptide/oligopeptide/nickel transport system permease component
MWPFIARRAVHAVIAIILSTFLIYVGLIQLGDPFSDKYEKTVRPEVRAALNAKFGMDKPFLLRYLIYLKNLATGDLGIDFNKRRPVTELMMEAAPNTLRLALVAIGIVILIGVTCGVLAAVFRSPFVNVLTAVVVVLAVSIPSFVIGVLLRVHVSGLHLFGIDIFPLIPRPFGVEVPWYKDVLLPAITLAVHEAAVIARLMQTSTLDVLEADYIRTARAKGLSWFRVVRKHVVRNALLPVVNYAGISLGVLMGGALIIESIFQYNGIGRLFVRALATNNNPVIVGVAVYSLITFIVLSALADVLSAYLDPRIRLH